MVVEEQVHRAANVVANKGRARPVLPYPIVMLPISIRGPDLLGLGDPKARFRNLPRRHRFGRWADRRRDWLAVCPTHKSASGLRIGLIARVILDSVRYMDTSDFGATPYGSFDLGRNG